MSNFKTFLDLMIHLPLPRFTTGNDKRAKPWSLNAAVFEGRKSHVKSAYVTQKGVIILEMWIHISDIRVIIALKLTH